MLIVKHIDKANHFIVGYLIYATLFNFIGYWSVIPVLIAAFGKEVYDLYEKNEAIEMGKIDWLDFVYTIAGVLPMLITQIIK